ncbi:hypothetical protein D3C73_1662830 [compost metagenome]
MELEPLLLMVIFSLDKALSLRLPVMVIESLDKVYLPTWLGRGSSAATGSGFLLNTDL